MMSKKERQEAAALDARLAKFTKEEFVVKYLLKTKPPLLRIGQEHWLDRNVLLDEMKGLQDKLLIHGYEDRSKRLKYLVTTLSQKWVNKPTIFTSAIRFLIELNEHPTGVVSLDLKDTVYSTSPEPIEPKLNENEEEIIAEAKRQARLKDEIVIELLEARSDFDMHFSGSDDDDADNSIWKLSFNEDDDGVELDSETKTKITPKSERKHKEERYTTLAEIKAKADAQLAIHEYWKNESLNASVFVDCKLRKVQEVSLNRQPVIATELTVHEKFGEFWEWKKITEAAASAPASDTRFPTPISSTIKPSRIILMENDLIREILWQLTSPNPTQSHVFNPDWSLKSQIMISSVSHSSLSSLMLIFTELLSKVHLVHQFINNVERNQNIVSETSQFIMTPCKMYRVYAYGLAEILRHLSKQLNSIELNLKDKSDGEADLSQSTAAPCTTLVQLRHQLNSYFVIIRALESFHKEVVNISMVTSPHWYTSIKLISALQMRLGHELNPSLYPLLFYLFVQCFGVFLEGIILTLSNLDWTDSECLFIRKADVELSDSNFWTDSIIPQPLRAKLMEEHIRPFSCLQNLTPKLLTTLKILEMVNLLNEDKIVDIVLGTLPKTQDIIAKFMQRIISNPVKNAATTGINNANQSTQPKPNCLPEEEYRKYFNFLGLEQDSAIADSFDFLFTDNHQEKQEESLAKESPDWTQLPIFLQNFVSIPFMSVDKELNDVLDLIFDPYFSSTRLSLYKILESYQVNESIALFREIVLGEREDFAAAVDDLAKRVTVAPELSYEDEFYRNPFYQKILNECYPEGRDNFEIRFLLQPKSSLNYILDAKPHFPLNLILTQKSIDLYFEISRLLHRVRKNLWALNRLDIAKCKVTPGVTAKRLQFFRFALLHFCSSIRSFLLLKIFSTGFDWSQPISPSSDLDTVIKAHENYLHGIETRVLKDYQLNNIVIKQISIMTLKLCNDWETKGVKQSLIEKLEDVLFKCWSLLFDFTATIHSSALCNELAAYTGPIPAYLDKKSESIPLSKLSVIRLKSISSSRINK